MLDSAIAWFREAAREATFSGELLFDENLSRHTYYRIGGPAAIMAFPKSIKDLIWLKTAISATGVPYAIIGAGSNLLVADIGFAGLVIRTNRLNSEIGICTERPPHACLDPSIRPFRLRTGGSVAVSSLLRTAMQQGWGGLEFLCGIPGLVAGAVAMNAGTHLGEVKDRIMRVETFDLEGPPDETELKIHEYPALRFEYRRSLFLSQSSIVYAAEWNLQHVSPNDVRATIERTLARRKETQPINFPSCGSVFKNPAGAHAWEVINRLGLRGHRIGNAQFSVKHSNFIVNLGNAKAVEVRALIELARTRAHAELGVELEPEVRFLGEDE